ncbi:nicotinamide mononucleotide transporter [Alcanivorax sp. 1008]|uniref:nicotinamide mononucleotide transporter n=1 Tax=Alcanivorax sp. 1008 TaxID=2816853 RepID=UPI00351D4335
MTLQHVEAVGVVIAIIGALLTANRRPVIGYPVMALSCVVLAALFIETGQVYLLTMQLTFLAINLNGTWAWSRQAKENERKSV